MIISLHKIDFLPHLSCAVDLNLNPGTILLLKGENGIGKSSLAKEIFNNQAAITSMIRQEETDIFYDRSLKQIKKIFKSSAGENLTQSLFEKYWLRFGLDKKEDRLQSRLSGGEAQMLKICLAAFLNRELIIFDEPSQNLDSSMQKVLNELIGELCSLQKKILMIEHETSWLTQKAETIKLIVKDHVLKVETL